MKIVRTEKLILTQEEVDMLNKTSELLGIIHAISDNFGSIGELASKALESIRELLDDYNDIE